MKVYKMSLKISLVIAFSLLMLSNTALAKPVPQVPLGTSLYDKNRLAKYEIPGSPMFFIPPRADGVFGGFLYHFPSEIQEHLLFCLRDKNYSFGPFCKDEFSFDEKQAIGTKGSLLRVQRAKGNAFDLDFQQKVVYPIENMTSVGYGLLDDITIYDLNDVYYRDVVQLPEIDKLPLNTSGIKGNVRFHGVQSQDHKEIYAIYYPELSKETKNNPGAVKAVILLQAFYPLKFEKQLLEELLPGLQNNIQVYAAAL